MKFLPCSLFGLLAVVLAVCGLTSLRAAENAPAVPEATGLEGMDWVLTALNGKAPAEGVKPPTLHLDAAKKQATGFSGVNRFFGGYERDGAKLKFGGLAGTRMAGPPEAMATETAFLAALASVSEWQITDGALELLHDGKVLARFTKK